MGPAAATPSPANVATSDLSFFDAYAPTSAPEQKQVFQVIYSTRPDILNVRFSYIKVAFQNLKAEVDFFLCVTVYFY